jgi:RNA polymerase sigma factor (sigma-70 family)
MAKAIDLFMHQLRISLDPLRQTTESDGQLLTRWLNSHDERAFTVLVCRHRALVWRVSRGVLRRAEDAEEVFQATFLVLARKAAGLKRRPSLSGWLYQTAHHLALNARTAKTRRQRHEEQNSMKTPTDPLEEIGVREARAILDEELNRLSAVHREAILFCLYEGATQDEAAKRLGCSLSTLKRRLERGRSLLSRRLAKRGLAPESAFALTLCEHANVPVRVLHETIVAASKFAAGEAVTGGAALLAQSALRTVLVKKLAMGFAVVLGSLTLVAGTLRAPSAEPGADGKDRFALNARHDIINDESEPRVDAKGDPLPAGAIQRIGTAGLRHSGAVQSVLYTPDGKSIVSLSRDGFLNLWDATTGRLRWRFADKGINYLSEMAISSGGQTIAVLNDRNYLKVDANTGMQLIECKIPITDIVPGCQAIAPNLKFFARGLNDGTVRLYDAETGQEKVRVVVFDKVPRRILKAVQFSGDGSKIYAMEEYGQQIRVFDAKTGNAEPPLHFWKELEKPRLVMSPKHTLLAAVDFNMTRDQVMIWDLGAGKERFFWPKSRLQLRCSAFSPKDDMLAMGVFGEGIVIYATVEDMKPRTLPVGPWPSSMVFSPDGSSIACGDEEGCITIWNVTTGKASQPSPEPKNLLSVRFANRGREILSVGSEIDYWNAKSGELVRRITRQLLPVTSDDPIAVSQDGKLIAETNLDQIFISTASGKRLHTLRAGLYVNNLTFSLDGTKLFSASRDGRLAIWDASSGKPLHNMENDQRGNVMLAVSPNGRWLASAAHSNRLTKDSDIQLWEIETGKLVHRLVPRSGGATAMCFSSDSLQLVCSFGDPTFGGPTKDSAVKIWDAEAGKEMYTFRFSHGNIGFIALNQNSRMFATAGGDPSHRGALANVDKSVYLWEIASGKERCRFTGHDTAVFSLDFSPDGALLAAASRDIPIFLWNVYGSQKLANGNLSYDAAKQLWQQLADSDAALAFKAICDLIARPNEAVILLENAWKALPRATEKQMRQWVEDLNSEQFAVRKSASEELVRFAANHEDMLRETLQKANSLEARQRLEQILARIEPERVRRGRMLEVLEQLPTPEARRFLQTLTEQREDTILAREAAAGLKRLAERK